MISELRYLLPAVAAGIILATVPGHAQELIGSAALTGVAGAYAAMPDQPQVFLHNPAMPVHSDSNSADLSYRHLYQLADLEELNGSLVYHYGERTALGLGLTHFGSPGLYTELSISTAIGRYLLPGWSLGIGVTYNRIEFGTGAAVYSGATIDLGTAWQYSPQWLLAAAFRNLTIDQLWQNERSAYAADLSVAWTLPPDLTIAARWYRARGEDGHAAIGQILRLTDEASFHSGLRFDPIRYALGGAVSHHTLRVDYAYEGHPDLGGTHTIGLGFRWR